MGVTGQTRGVQLPLAVLGNFDALGKERRHLRKEGHRLQEIRENAFENGQPLGEFFVPQVGRVRQLLVAVVDEGVAYLRVGGLRALLVLDSFDIRQHPEGRSVLRGFRLLVPLGDLRHPRGLRRSRLDAAEDPQEPDPPPQVTGA